MQRFFLSLLTLTFAFQPVLASAYTVKGVERTSRRSVVNAYKAQEQRRASTRAGMVKAPTVITPTTYAPIGDYVPALPATGFSLGDLSAPVTIVEFLDYACPYCAAFAADTMPKIKSTYVDTGKVRFVFRNFPISYHPAAGVAAQAVECSRKQSEDYALQMMDKLFAVTAKNGELTQNDVYSAFTSLDGIDTEKMYYCIDTAETVAQITADIDDAVNGGVNGVPSFWVLGKHGRAVLVQGSLDFAGFKKVIETKLK